MSDEVRGRAAAVLKVPLDATAAEAADAFLSRLPEVEFVPSSDAITAVNTLAGLSLPDDATGTSALRGEVEEFARQYWSLNPADRLARWLTLSTRSPDDATAERLAALQAGLELPGNPFPNAATEKVLAIVRELSVLPPRERSIRRNSWLLANSRRHHDLVAIAADVQKNQPGFASLEPVLFARLTPGFNVRAFVEAATTAPMPKRPEVPAESISYSPPPRYYPKPVPAREPFRASSRTPDRAIIGIMCFMLFLASKVFGVLGGCASSNPPRHELPTYTPDYSITQEKRPAGIPSYFTPDQVQKFRDYESKGAPTTARPPFYYEWTQAGRPEAWKFTDRK